MFVKINQMTPLVQGVLKGFCQIDGSYYYVENVRSKFYKRSDDEASYQIDIGDAVRMYDGKCGRIVVKNSVCDGVEAFESLSFTPSDTIDKRALYESLLNNLVESDDFQFSIGENFFPLIEKYTDLFVPSLDNISRWISIDYGVSEITSFFNIQFKTELLEEGFYIEGFVFLHNKPIHYFDTMIPFKDDYNDGLSDFDVDDIKVVKYDNYIN